MPIAVSVDQVVFFQVNQIKNRQLDILYQTKNNFKIYQDNLNFEYQSASSFPAQLPFSAKKPAIIYHDPVLKKVKKVFLSPNHFTINLNEKPSDSAVLKVHVQACAEQICLLPVTLTLPVREGASSFLDQGSNVSLNLTPDDGDEGQKTSGSSKSEIASPSNSSNEKTEFALQATIAKYLKNGSVFLFPALFFAGLLMNLTPCVYPMIPITINVLSQFGTQERISEEEKRRRRRLYPVVYVLGMVLTYSVLGVFAGMTGTLFGAHMSSLWFNVSISGVMFLLGFMMMGYIDVARIQNLGYAVPLAKNRPAVAVGTMGAVSGLVAAPCTGPVLSLILILISQTQNAFLGFLYMFVFSLGFGVPYIFLGFLSQKFAKLPRFPSMMFLSKMFFSSLIFALALYFLKGLFRKFQFLDVVFSQPPALIVIGTGLLAVVFFVLTLREQKKRRVILEIMTIVMTTILCLWGTFYVTHAFRVGAPTNQKFSETSKGQIAWLQSLDEAYVASQGTGKPILVDIWANWCSACLEMEHTTWRDPKIVKMIQDHYIAVKIDDTNPTKNVDNFIEKWKIVGLPAVLIFPEKAGAHTAPLKVFQGEVNKQWLLENLKMNAERRAF